MGNSGYCMKNRANHCHFIVWKNGVRVNPIKHLYVYEDNVVAKSNTYNLLKYTKDDPQSYTGEYPKLKNGIFGWKRGDKNKNVGLIQKYLNWCLGCHLEIDNSFGNLTEKQVKVFQKKYGLIEDGKVGPRTIKIMKTIKK